MKKVISFLMIILIMISICGCGVQGQDKVDRMVSYINEKYSDDSFEFMQMSGGHLGSNVAKIIVKSDKFPDKEIRVICSEVDGVEIFTDTYLNIKFEKETYNYIKNALTSIYGENIYIKYIPDDLACTKNGSSDMTFDEYIAERSSYIYFSAAVMGDANNEEATLATIKDLFKNAVIEGNIYFMDTDESLIDNGLALIKDKSYKKNLYILKETVNEYSEIEWSEPNE